MSLDQLMEELVQSPLVEICGVVRAGGASVGWTRGRPGYTVLVRLSAWRVMCGPMERVELIVHADLGKEEAQALAARFVEYQVVAMTVRLAVKSVLGAPRALYISNLRVVESDAELLREASRLKEPVLIEDPVFGILKLDRQLGWFGGHIQHQAKAIPITLTADSRDSPSESLRWARLLHQNLEERVLSAASFATKELLEAKNTAWLLDGEQPQTQESFMGALSLQSVAVQSDGTLEFWFDPRDLFSGHWILVSGTFAQGFQKADLCG